MVGLKRCSGISTWNIMDYDKKWYRNSKEVPEKRQKKIPFTVFPPTEEEAKKFELHKW